MEPPADANAAIYFHILYFRPAPDRLRCPVHILPPCGVPQGSRASAVARRQQLSAFVF